MFEKDRKDKSAKDGATWYFSDASAKAGDHLSLNRFGEKGKT